MLTQILAGASLYALGFATGWQGARRRHRRLWIEDARAEADGAARVERAPAPRARVPKMGTLVVIAIACSGLQASTSQREFEVHDAVAIPDPEQATAAHLAGAYETGSAAAIVEGIDVAVIGRDAERLLLKVSNHHEVAIRALKGSLDVRDIFGDCVVNVHLELVLGREAPPIEPGGFLQVDALDQAHRWCGGNTVADVDLETLEALWRLQHVVFADGSELDVTGVPRTLRGRLL